MKSNEFGEWLNDPDNAETFRTIQQAFAKNDLDTVVDYLEASQPSPEEEKYEAISLTIKSRQDGVAWFDIIFDLVTDNCDTGISDDDEFELYPSCSCGLESMGGMSGTLNECYKWLGLDDE